MAHALSLHIIEPCLAWSPKEPNYERWDQCCGLKRPFVYEIDGEISGFLELDTGGHIDCAYVNPDFKKQGLMGKLIRHVLKWI